MNLQTARATIEALIFLSGAPISTKEIARLTGLDDFTVDSLARELSQLYMGEGRGVRLMEIGGGWQLCTCPDLSPEITRIMGERKGARLSQAALETLAIIAYRQPITKGEIEQIRGVNVDGVVGALIERDLITEMGRKDTVGRPILYGVSIRFLRHFGLQSVDDLPRLEGALDLLSAEEKEELDKLMTPKEEDIPSFDQE